ncbi:MAG: GIY-YIG nuclease family protein [Candidatus Kryptonium sp.]|nr:GIY-YIG nuclease family protein [Candidatus Kryptonium sp.]MCX7763208.1 GIY-YIG nuclease family protein [Candidatus Kryptonium sp.]MDW8109178.1 GIY-YIG nuclease family protein [Candidatus Kryptonium sp.]
MSYFVYILKSLKDDNFYIGHTRDISKRLNQHNSGKVKATKGRRPLKLIYVEKFETRSEAFKREKFLKSPAGYFEKMDIIAKFGN